MGARSKRRGIGRAGAYFWVDRAALELAILGKINALQCDWSEQESTEGRAMTEATTFRPLGVIHLALVGALTFALLYVLCWAGAVLGFSGVSHLYLALFAPGETTTFLALLQSVCLSLGWGALTGALIAIFFNLFGFLAPR